jgi:hypothetical protein
MVGKGQILGPGQEKTAMLGSQFPLAKSQFLLAKSQHWLRDVDTYYLTSGKKAQG